MTYNTHDSPSQETCIQDLYLDFTNLLSTENIDSAKAASAISYERYESALRTQLSFRGGTTDIPIQDRLSKLFSSSQTRMKKQEDQWLQQHRAVVIGHENDYKQGD